MVVLQHPQNSLLLLLYQGCTPLSASVKQFTIDTSLWAHPCCAGTLVHRQLCCSEQLLGAFCLLLQQTAISGLLPAPLGNGPHVVKSDSGSKCNFLQHSREILS